MKKILMLLLLLPCIGSGQIVVNRGYHPLSSVTTNGTAFGLSSATFTANRLYLLVAQTTGTTNPGTITSTTTTWTNVANVGNSTNRIQIFRYMSSSTVTGETVNIGTFGGGSTGFSVAVYEITGVVTTGTNGADAIAQFVTQSATTSADPSLTLSALTGNNNTVIGFFSNDANPFGGSEESGWTEIFDGGYNDPVTGMYETSRSLTTDNSVVVTAPSSTWIGVAIELQSGQNRRIFNVN